MRTCARKHDSNTNFNGHRREARSVMGSGFFTQPVVRSSDAVHPPAAPPPPTPFPAAESLVAPGSPFPAKDGFSVGDSTQCDLIRQFRDTARDTKNNSAGGTAQCGSGFWPSREKYNPNRS